MAVNVVSEGGSGDGDIDVACVSVVCAVHDVHARGVAFRCGAWDEDFSVYMQVCVFTDEACKVPNDIVVSAYNVCAGAAGDGVNSVRVLLGFTFALCITMLAFRLCVRDDFKVESHSGGGLELLVVQMVGRVCGGQEEAAGSGTSSAEDDSTVLFGGIGVGESFLDVLLDECSGDLFLAWLRACGGPVINMGAIIGEGGEGSSCF